VTADVSTSPQTLLSLQHTNIVPIYSIHRPAKLQAVCMPYFGATTLADVLSPCRKPAELPDSGQVRGQHTQNRRASTQHNGAVQNPSEPALGSRFEEKNAPAPGAESSDGEGY